MYILSFICNELAVFCFLISHVFNFHASYVRYASEIDFLYFVNDTSEFRQFLRRKFSFKLNAAGDSVLHKSSLEPIQFEMKSKMQAKLIAHSSFKKRKCEMWTMWTYYDVRNLCVR